MTPSIGVPLLSRPAGAADGEEDGSVALFRRRPQAGRVATRATSQADIEHLEQFVRSRRGVEALIEPRTTVTETTVILIAHDGEWTRRRVGSPDDAWRFGRRLGIPVYDVAHVGYPQRMRDYNARRGNAQA
jgi:hypothetical protein